MSVPANCLLAMVALCGAGMAAGGEDCPLHLKGLVALSEGVQAVEEELELPCSVGGGIGAPTSPHAGSSIRVYANQVLLDHLRRHPEGFDFPVGSVLLKEKFAKDAKAAHLYTRMERKTAKGRVMDWKFSAQSLDGSEDASNFREARCATCHDDFEDTGFVSESTVSLLREFLKAVAAPAGDPPG